MSRRKRPSWMNAVPSRSMSCGSCDSGASAASRTSAELMCKNPRVRYQIARAGSRPDGLYFASPLAAFLVDGDFRRRDRRGARLSGGGAVLLHLALAVEDHALVDRERRRRDVAPHAGGGVDLHRALRVDVAVDRPLDDDRADVD